MRRDTPSIMSVRNVELVRQVIEAINARDEEAFIALNDPSVEATSAMTVPGGGVYHGHGGLRRFIRDRDEAWQEGYRIEAEAYFDLGERVLLFCVFHGRGKQSGAEVAMQSAIVSRWRDGLMVYWKSYPDRGDALRELGVSEDELDPIAP